MRDPSVTQWIQRLNGGDDEAAEQIWERFFGRVQSLAKFRMGAAQLGAKDAEDVALSAMYALCMGARENRFRKLGNREELWAILATITVRKVIDAQRSERTSGTPAYETFEPEELVDRTPLLGLGDEECYDALCATSREMLEQLEPKLRDVALLRLEGYSNDEIAERTQRSRPTVERHLRMIRHAWSP